MSERTKGLLLAPAQRRGFRLCRIAGVDLHVDWSLALVFILIAANLGAGLFPAWHPDWSPALSWTVAIAAAVLFFGSVAAHEMAHAIVGRANGIPVRRVTLFVFGGMAHMEGEPPNARAELWMAVVGPITSLVIGIGATVAGVLLSDWSMATMGEEPMAAAQAMGPVATLLMWLGPINVLLAVFNLLPGFPLDGGRVLRAALWWATGDLRKATRWAAGIGQAFAWALMGVGIAMLFGARVPWLGGGVVQGIWLLLIGWFLSNAARMSYEAVIARQALEGVRVRELMRAPTASVPIDLSVAALVKDYIMATDAHSFPVMEGDALAGVASLDDLQKAPRDRWSEMRVADIMTPLSELQVLGPDDEAMDALRKLGEHGQIPVVDHDRLVGMTYQRDVLKWLALQTRTPT